MGGNLGDRADFLAKAKDQTSVRCGLVVKQSSLYETAAWGMEEQDAFLNQALAIETKFEAERLLKELLQIEEGLGRKREAKYGPRVIDIDLLFFNDSVIRLPHLTVPHPQVQARRFALVPLSEIAPDLVHPVFQKTIAQLLHECPDPLPVQKIS
jgi:2-amino-4-hydroxy-6-hydroxymethyldihydropteridine diphosphokinase